MSNRPVSQFGAPSTSRSSVGGGHGGCLDTTSVVQLIEALHNYETREQALLLLSKVYMFACTEKILYIVSMNHEKMFLCWFFEFWLLRKCGNIQLQENRLGCRFCLEHYILLFYLL